MKMFLTLLVATGLRLVAVGQNVVQIEYFLDTDAGIGKNTLLSITLSSNGSFPLTLDVSGAAAGYHQLYMRLRDDNGAWGLATRKLVEVVPAATAKNIAGGEYFFDQDPGVGGGAILAVSPLDSVILQNLAATVNGLAPGIHKLYTRLRDTYGLWSQTSRTTADIVPVDTKNSVANGEYFFDQDPGFGAATAAAVSPKDSVVEQSFTAAVTRLAPGYHLLYGRWKDSSGRWSQTMRRMVEVVKSTDTDYVASLEYFFKEDPGFGNAHVLQLPAPAQNGTVAFTIPLQYIPLTTASDTLFKLFVRAKDNGTANWSITQYKDGIKGLANGPLPLTFISFNAVKQKDEAMLNWQTTNEVNTGYFNILRSPDGNSFATIAKVAAKGNSILHGNYTYADAIAGIKSGKLYYRLQEVDQDGKLTYSNTATVSIESENAVFTVAPNPANDYITVIPGNNTNSANAIIVITDLAGHVLIKQKLAGNSNQRISVSSFANGIYTISIITPESMQTQKLFIR